MIVTEEESHGPAAMTVPYSGWKYALLVLLLSLPRMVLPAGDRPKSVVFKNFKIPPLTFIQRSHDRSYEFWQEFQLVQKANANDPVAQHELGLRYLTGDGFMADTVKAVYWVRKAAEQNLPLANYNYGVFLNNGLGVHWNPFEAYRFFRTAAVSGVAQAQYMLGSFLSDELALPRNIPEAFRWFKAAADSGFDPAREVLGEFAERGWDRITDSSNENDDGGRSVPKKDSAAGTVRVVSSIGSVSANLATDTIPAPSLQKLITETVKYGIANDEDTTGSGDQQLSDSTLSKARRAAQWGSPEALTLLGFCYEHGISVVVDHVRACVYYLAAMRLDGPRAPFLLYGLIHAGDFFGLLHDRIRQNDAGAGYAWAGLCAFGLDAQLTDRQALDFLNEAAEQGYVEAVVELALCYHSGKWVKQDKQKGRELLNQAARMGSVEARLRLIMSEKLDGGKSDEEASTLADILAASQQGSVLAQEMLGYCYEKGFLVGAWQPEAVRYYRMAAQRGSLAAYNALKEMYNRMRPPQDEFEMYE